MEGKAVKGIQTFFKNEIRVDGFAAELIPINEKGKVHTKGSITSLSNSFFTYAENICKLIGCDPKNTNQLLIIIDKDCKARICLNNFPVITKQRLKKDVQKGEKIFRHDILHISEIEFANSENEFNPKDGDQLIWLFRIGFVFGLYFDLSKKLNFELAKQEMGHVYQQVLYFDLYNSLSQQNIDSLRQYGWFPFIQILGKEYNALVSFITEEKTSYLETWSDETFTDEWVKKVVSRWWGNEIFKKKQRPIEEGLECFFENKYAASISTLIPMVEGLINSFSVENRGKGIKYNGDKIASTLIDQSKEKVDPHSLLFPSLFADYLQEHFYQNTRSAESDQAVRNTVAHGRAFDKSFTRETTIKIILTLDQILFYV